MQLLHWFFDPIRHHYADFEGRVGRQEFWMFVLWAYALYLVLEILGLDILSVLIGLGTLLPHLALCARRLHDTGRSGWWQLLIVVPIIGWIILVVWCAEKTTPADNVYGQPAVPKVAVEPVTPEPAPTPASAESVADTDSN